MKAAWAGGHPILLTGPAGIGKTTLARQYAATVGRRPLWIIGTPAMTDTPLAAVTAAVPVTAADGAPDIVDRLRERIAGGAIVVVEAAEHLDAASAAIVGRLLGSVAQAGIVTAGAPLHPSLGVALETAGVVEVALAPLDLGATTALVEERLGGALAVPDAVRIHRICEGNPFYLTEYVDGAAGTGDLRPSADGLWRLGPDAAVSDDLRRAGAERLAAASASERRLIDLLTLCEPLPSSVVNRLDLADGVSATEGGLVLPLDDTVVPGHAIFTEIRRAELGSLQRRRLVGELVDVLGETVAAPVERLHRARLCLEYHLPLDGGVLTECSATAFLLGDLPLAAALAERAVAGGAGLPALLQLSRARSGMGEGDRARNLLSGVEPDSLDEPELAGYAITVAINHTIGDGDHSGALSVLDKLEPRVQETAMRSAFAALRSISHVNAGNQFPALRWARRAQAIEAGAPLWTALGQFVEAEALRRAGETRRPIALAREAVRSTRSLASLVGTGARRTLVQALLSAGDLPAAQREADELLEATLLQHTPQAIACSTAALVESARGRFSLARRHCEDALASLAADDRTGLGRGTAMQLAAICAVTGDVDATRRAHTQAGRATVQDRGWPGINPRLAAAFVQIAEGEITRPSATFRAVATECLAAEQRSDALGVLHWAVRLGDIAAAQRFLEIGTGSEGVVAGLQRTHASALAAGDPGGLREVSDEFARLGYLPVAVDVLAQAVTAYRADGQARNGRRAAGRLADLRSRYDAATTPATRAADDGAVLTRREAEIAAMVAGGFTITEIAARLTISPSTVRSVALRVRKG